MGITLGTLEFMNRNLVLVPGLKIVELGDQRFWIGDMLTYPYAKQFFEAAGMSCTSIDWNGNNGALVLDMGKPIPEELKSNFNILTDFGFIEHVQDQYECFKNVHNLVKPGGVILHELPGQPHFTGHEEFFYYTPVFFEVLAKLNRYRLLANTLRFDGFGGGGFVLDVVLMRGEGDFIDRASFETLPICRN